MQEFLEFTIFDIKLINIIIAIVILSLSFLLRKVVSKVIITTLKTFAKKTKSDIDDKLIEILEEPLKLACIVLGLYLAKEWLQIASFENILQTIIKSLATFILFWVLFRTVERFEYIVAKFSQKFGKELGKDIENFIVKTLKLLIIIIGFMTILQEWGINVSAFVASLGLVGMAFALAAKDTAANLFGSLVIFTDRPFRIGDWIQTPNVEGTVEEIGIRSTKVRTFAQALVSVPNADIANKAITNWSRMGKRRIKMRLGLTYDTNTAQMSKILEDLRSMLTSHEAVHKDTIMIHFDEFQDSSLSLFCYFFTTTTVWAEYLAAREDINLKMMKIVEDNGASFAFPSQSIYIENSSAQQML